MAINKHRILFVYTGHEQGSWGTIAYTRKSHYYIMPGILYCVSSLYNDPELRDSCDITYRYFNKTVEKSEEILAALTIEHWKIVGFSSYCWNIQDNLSLAQKIKQRTPETIILFGGPEIAHDNSDTARSFFQHNPFVDCCVYGDAEEKLPALTKALLRSDPDSITGTTGFAWQSPTGQIFNNERQPAPDLNTIPSIYPHEVSVPLTEESGLAMVYETGRGCPYRCIYCKFGHQSTKVKNLALERVAKELQWLLTRNIACIHVADAVFDQHPDYAKEVCRIIARHNHATSIFFYCSFTGLDDELAALLALLQCQICVGVQSTNPDVLRALRRALNPSLFEKLRGLLHNHSLNFYIDLIFGLPFDNPDSFANSFNQVISLDPSFIMAFPLSLIKDTELANHADDYGIITWPQEQLETLDLSCDIEYQNIGLYKDFSGSDLVRFDDMALSLFYFYCRFPYTLAYLKERTALDAFTLYQSIGEQTKRFLNAIGQRASNTNLIEGFQDEIFSIFLTILDGNTIGETEMKAFNELFKIDIFRILLLNAPQRQKLFETSLTLKPNQIHPLTMNNLKECRIRKFIYGKILTLPFSLHDLLNLHVLRDTIPFVQDQAFIYAPFGNWNASIIRITAIERFCIEFIPDNRGIRTQSLIQALHHQFKNDTSWQENMILRLIQSMEDRKIFMVYQ